jgi:hypothetical protein
MASQVMKTDFVLGSPLFTKSNIHFENGNTLAIEAPANNAQNIYIQSASLNDFSYYKSFISYTDLLMGGTLKFSMSTRPSTRFGKQVASMPSTSVADTAWVNAPIVVAPSKTFKEKIDVVLTASHSIFYTTDGTEPNRKSTLYKSPIQLNKNTIVKAVAIDERGNTSHTTEAVFYKMPSNLRVQLLSRYNAQYSAGGDEGIVDGIRGSENWRKGEWQGYQNQNFEAVLDLTKTRSITEIGIGLLQDTRSWILMPKRVEFFVSVDGKNFTKAAEVTHTVDPQDYTVQTKDLLAKLTKKTKARYVKVIAHNFGTLPEWHQGHPFRGEAFIFTDEVWVK